MPVIELDLLILAPIERVFDLSRSVEVHIASTAGTDERAVGGVTGGLLSLHDEVTWEATHFGFRQRLTSRMVALQRPHYFRDSMVAGAFQRFDHDHFFSQVHGGTLVRDRFDFDAPWGALGRVANAWVLTRYMRQLLENRLQAIKELAESCDFPELQA